MDFHPAELLHWWETRTNRPRERSAFERALPGSWAVGAGATSWPPATPIEPELMVILTTYGRPGAAARVLDQLREALAHAGLTRRSALLVMHDACGQNYGLARELASRASPTVLWLDARERFGKAGFWKMHQTAFVVAGAWRPKLALYLQDDVELEPDFLLRALELWRSTAVDPRRRVLYLFSSSDDEARGRWVRFARRARDRCRLTNWFDLQAFLVDSAFFDLLEHRMVPIHPNRWKRQPELSSGVGRQLTLRLFGRGHVYQAWPPLIVHGAAPSMMNPEARARRTLDNRADYVPSQRPSPA